jgi:hypothetical protein
MELNSQSESRNHNKFGDLKQQKHILSQIWRTEAWKVMLGLQYFQALLGYEAGHPLRGQRTLETKEVTSQGLFSS